MWNRLFARWSIGRAVKKYSPTSIDSTDMWTSASSHERREREEHKDLVTTNDEVSGQERVGPLVDGSCSSQSAKEAYIHGPSAPEKTKLHYFWFSTPALQVYSGIFLAIISRDIKFLHCISLALGFQMLTVISKWVKCISQSSDLRDIKRYFLLSLRMPLSQLEQSIEGGAFRRSLERATLVTGYGLTKWVSIWSISRSHMHDLNGSLVKEWENRVRQDDEMYKSYVQTCKNNNEKYFLRPAKVVDELVIVDCCFMNE